MTLYSNYIKRANIKSKILYRTKWFCICFAHSFDMKCCIWKPLYEILFFLPSRPSHRYKLLPLLLCLVPTLMFQVHPFWKQNHYLYEHSVLLRMIKISHYFSTLLDAKVCTILSRGLSIEYVLLWCCSIILMPKDLCIFYHCNKTSNIFCSFYIL